MQLFAKRPVFGQNEGMKPEIKTPMRPASQDGKQAKKAKLAKALKENLLRRKAVAKGKP